MQFTLKSLIIASVIVALICSVFFTLPNGFTLLAILISVPLLSALLVSIIVYDRQCGRAFAIGALVCLGSIGAVVMSSDLYLSASSINVLKTLAAITLVLVPLSGFASTFVYWASLKDSQLPNHPGETNESS